MNITQGPMLEKFAAIFSIPVDEVVEWVNSYVNKPEEATNPEKTERDRLQSIKGYITRRIDESSHGKIASFIAEQKRKAA